jgi:hypothetical protein
MNLRCELGDYVVVESVEHDEEDADSWREAQNSLLGEGVWLEFAILERPDGILFRLVATVERS